MIKMEPVSDSVRRPRARRPTRLKLIARRLACAVVGVSAVSLALLNMHMYLRERPGPLLTDDAKVDLGIFHVRQGTIGMRPPTHLADIPGRTIHAIGRATSESVHTQGIVHKGVWLALELADDGGANRGFLLLRRPLSRRFCPGSWGLFTQVSRYNDSTCLVALLQRSALNPPPLGSFATTCTLAWGGLGPVWWWRWLVSDLI